MTGPPIHIIMSILNIKRCHRWWTIYIKNFTDAKGFKVVRSNGNLDDGWDFSTDPITVMFASNKSNDSHDMGLDLLVELYKEDIDMCKKVRLNEFLQTNPQIKLTKPLELVTDCERYFHMFEEHVCGYMTKYKIDYTFTY